MLYPEIKFPRNPGIPGDSVPLADFEDFDAASYVGETSYPATFGPAIKYSVDPAGSSRVCTRWEIPFGGKTQWGDQRIELWREDPTSAQNQGDKGWQAWSWFTGDGTKGDLFRLPTTWALFWQNHGIAEPGSPAQALIIVDGVWRFSRRLSESDPYADDNRPIAPVTLGHWHHFLTYIEYSANPDGVMKVWHRMDTPPDSSTPPGLVFNGCTLLGHPSRPNIHLYRAPSSVQSQYPYIAYNGGYGRADTAARAQELAWPVAVVTPPPTPTVNVPSAIVHLKETLAWMTRSKKTGGLGYSVINAKTTHVYKALVDLGGVWP